MTIGEGRFQPEFFIPDIISFIDSTHIPVCENKREYSYRIFKGYASKGKRLIGWYYKFKLPLLCNKREQSLNLTLTQASTENPKPQLFKNLTENLFKKSHMPIKVIFPNHFLLHSSIGEFTSSREYALI